MLYDNRKTRARIPAQSKAYLFHSKITNSLNLCLDYFENLVLDFHLFISDCLQNPKPNESLKNCNSYIFKYSGIKMHLQKYSQTCKFWLLNDFKTTQVLDVVTILDVISVLDLLRIIRNLFLKVPLLNQKFTKRLNNLILYILKYS